MENSLQVRSKTLLCTSLHNIIRTHPRFHRLLRELHAQKPTRRPRPSQRRHCNKKLEVVFLRQCSYLFRCRLRQRDTGEVLQSQSPSQALSHLPPKPPPRLRREESERAVFAMCFERCLDGKAKTSRTSMRSRRCSGWSRRGNLSVIVYGDQVPMLIIILIFRRMSA